MLAFGLVIVLFGFWQVIGYATLEVLPNRPNLIQNVLLAPAVGLAVTVVLVFSLSRLGLPVKQFGLILAIGLLLAGIFVLWRRRHQVFPWRRYLPFLGVFLLALLLTGRPLLEFGFNWLAYSSDDMANYVLGAQRFFNYGFSELPNVNDLITGRDYSLDYWFFHAVTGIRPGSELLIAWVSSLTGLSGPEVFMPLILAFQLILTSAAGALVCQSRRLRRAALVTCLLVSFSALTSLGTLYQLIAQVSGLSLLAACATVLMRSYRWVSWRSNLLRAALPGLLLAGLFIVYPEVLPFLVLALGVYLLLGLIQRRQTWRDILPNLGIIGLVVLLFINTYLPKSFYFLLLQTFQSSSATASFSLFPYFLLPSGLANLWGFQNLTLFIAEPWLSLSILGGGLLLLLAVFLVVRGSWRRQPAALISSAMLLVAAYMFLKHTDFGLFKLAMFIQPFLLGTLALTWANFRFKPFQIGRLVGPVILAVISIFSILTQATYIEAGRGFVKDNFASILDASSSDINSEFEQILATTRPQAVVLDDSNLPLTKLQTVYTRGLETSLFRSVFATIVPAKVPQQFFDDEMQKKSQEILDYVNKTYEKGTFNLLDNTNPSLKTDFTLTGPQNWDKKQALLISLTSKQSFFNRWGDKQTSQNFEAQSMNAVQNHLAFVFSELGQNFYLGERGRIAFYQLEKDPYFPSQTMSAIGRYFVFQAINPSASARLVLNMTDTTRNDSENRLSPAAALGATRQAFPIVGRGSARVFSPIINPQIINNQPYFGLDMGQDGTTFPFNRTGLMNLYSKDVALDIRQMVGFGRDISLVSDEQYQKMAAPEQVSNFPADLANPNLEYSGVYEDGWVSEAAFFGLNRPAGPAALIVRGTIPQIDSPGFKTEITVLVDGQEVARRPLGLGDFELKLTVPAQVGRHRVDLRFSYFQHLPGNDKRPVGALLRLVGFVPGVEVTWDVVANDSGMHLGQGWYDLETANGQPFRWVNNQAELVLDAPTGTEQNLSLELEPGPSLGNQPFQLEVVDQSGRVVATGQAEGRKTLLLKLPTKPGQANLFRLRVKSDNREVANDPRILNFRVFEIKKQ